MSDSREECIENTYKLSEYTTTYRYHDKKIRQDFSNRFLGRTASLNPTYVNTDLISYVSVGIACAIILQLIYIKLKRRA